MYFPLTIDSGFYRIFVPLLHVLVYA